MRKVAIGLLSAALTSGLLVAPAHANTCNPKLQGVCNLIHEVRCTLDETADAVEIEGHDLRLCTF
jgi:hypothetical protein